MSEQTHSALFDAVLSLHLVQGRQGGVPRQVAQLQRTRPAEQKSETELHCLVICCIQACYLYLLDQKFSQKSIASMTRCPTAQSSALTKRWSSWEHKGSRPQCGRAVLRNLGQQISSVSSEVSGTRKGLQQSAWYYLPKATWQPWAESYRLDTRYASIAD